MQSREAGLVATVGECIKACVFQKALQLLLTVRPIKWFVVYKIIINIIISFLHKHLIIKQQQA